MQERHVLTLSCCFIIPASNKIEDETIFSTVMEQVMEQGDDDTPLHLKLVLFHEECERNDMPVGMKIADMKKVLMPKQRVLKHLDPDGTQTVEQLRTKLAPLARLYIRVVLQDNIPAGTTLEEALGVYRNFHLLTYRADWEENEVPVACSCKTSFNHCICGDSLLYAAVFEPRVRVPADYIAMSVPERKARKSARGTAGRKRLRILAEMKDDEKVIDSKVKYMKETQPPPERALPTKPAADTDGRMDGAAGADNDLTIPSPVMPSSEEDEAQVGVCPGTTCIATDYVGGRRQLQPIGPGRAPRASPNQGPSLDFVFVVHRASRLQRYMTMFLPRIQELTLFSIHQQTKESAKVIGGARRGTGARRGKA